MGEPGTLHRVPRRPHAWLALFLPSQALVALAWWALGWRTGLPLLVLSHLPFVAATLLPRARLYAPVLSRLPLEDRSAWLTIDDGPSDDTLPILNLLDAHSARATSVMGTQSRNAAIGTGRVVRTVVTPATRRDR